MCVCRVRGVVSRAREALRTRAGREEEVEREWKEKVRETERRTSVRCQSFLRALSQERDKVSF